MKKKDKRIATSDTGTISTLLGRDTRIDGTFTFNETIRVDGYIKGKLVSEKGTVIIGDNAVIDADVHVGVAIVRGKVNGRIEARQKIEIYAPAQVEGDISAPTITIDSGVNFNGKCEMQQAPKAPDPKFGATPKPEEKASEKAVS
jgi:cytoskeletal protein CcmA (bactofilin family)